MWFGLVVAQSTKGPTSDAKRQKWFCHLTPEFHLTQPQVSIDHPKVHRKLYTARSLQAHADTPSQTQLFRPLRTVFQCILSRFHLESLGEEVNWAYLPPTTPWVFVEPRDRPGARKNVQASRRALPGDGGDDRRRCRGRPLGLRMCAQPRTASSLLSPLSSLLSPLSCLLSPVSSSFLLLSPPPSGLRLE